MKNPRPDLRTANLEKEVAATRRSLKQPKSAPQTPEAKWHIARTTADGVPNGYPDGGSVFPFVFVDGSKFDEVRGAQVEWTDLSSGAQRWAATVDGRYLNQNTDIVVFHQNGRWWIPTMGGGGGGGVQFAYTRNEITSASQGACSYQAGLGPIELIQHNPGDACDCWSTGPAAICYNLACRTIFMDRIIAVSAHPDTSCPNAFVFITDIGQRCAEPFCGRAQSITVDPYGPCGICPNSHEGTRPAVTDNNACILIGGGICNDTAICGWSAGKAEAYANANDPNHPNPACVRELGGGHQELGWPWVSVCLARAPASCNGTNPPVDLYYWIFSGQMVWWNSLSNQIGSNTVFSNSGAWTVFPDPGPDWFEAIFDGGEVTLQAWTTGFGLGCPAGVPITGKIKFYPR